MSTPPAPTCALCAVRDPVCRNPGGNAPEFCPTENLDDSVQNANAVYNEPATRAFARAATIQEAECYAGRELDPPAPHAVKPRIQEICEFARRSGFSRLGIAFCAGLTGEALAVHRVLAAQGFEVVSVICKVGATPKESLGLSDSQKIRAGSFEPMCSPIAQARLLNEQGSELNVVVGLCVGHDALFFKHAEAPCTVLIAKDRVLGHNPVAALYNLSGYYAHLLSPDPA